MGYKIVKRGIDILVSASALVVLLPLLLALAALVRLESPGSPLFVQPRVGRNGRIFSMLKLRSMVAGAPRLGSYMTADGDPRITRLGRVLRLTSLDELPQLWNVLAGDMSLIGPRPETPAQRELYSDADWQVRHRVRPGITGLAQVSGRSILTPQQRLEYDLAYACRVTPAADIRILIKTVRHLLTRVGAN